MKSVIHKFMQAIFSYYYPWWFDFKFEPIFAPALKLELG
jgi:hypothetical protein